jgi:hypothetical protein
MRTSIHSDSALTTARDLVGILVELAARMQAGQHDLGGGDAFLGVDVGGDAAAVIGDGDGPVAVQRDRDLRRIARLRLVHGVVDDLEGHVVQAGAVIGVADVHAWPLAHGLEPPQHGDGGAVVGILTLGRRGGGRGARGGVGHAGGGSFRRSAGP